MDICNPDKRLAAICGLFCPSCPVFIGTKEDPKRLEKMAKHFKCSAEELKCEGCRSDKLCIFCSVNCNISKCANGKGLDFCGECGEYPCEELKMFQPSMPNKLELWESLERIKEVGYEKWYEEMIEHYSCPKCHTINSVADISCRRCGNTPSCEYVSIHKEEILEHAARIRNESKD